MADKKNENFYSCIVLFSPAIIYVEQREIYVKLYTPNEIVVVKIFVHDP